MYIKSMYISSVLLQEAIREAHPLKESKPRKNGTQEKKTQLMRVLKGFPRMKARRSPRG